MNKYENRLDNILFYFSLKKQVKNYNLEMKC